MTVDRTKFNEIQEIPKGGLLNIQRANGGVLSFDDVEYTPGGGGGSLASLSDVNITSPQQGDVLEYIASAGKWQNHVPTGEGIAAKVHLTSAQLKHLVASPVVLLPSAGPGTVIWPLHAFAVYNFNAIPYTLGNFTYIWLGSAEEQGGGTGWMSVRCDGANGLFFLGADTIARFSLENALGPVPLGVEANTGLVVYGQGGGDELTDGDGTVDIYYRYTVITL